MMNKRTDIFHQRTDSVIKMLCICKLFYKFNAIPVKITIELLKLEKKNYKITLEE